MGKLRRVSQNQLPKLPWELPSCDSPLVLKEMSAIATICKKKVEGEAKFTYTLLPYPRVNCEFRTENAPISFTTSDVGQNLELGRFASQLPVFCTGIHVDSKGSARIRFLLNGTVFLGDKRARTALLQVVNFPDFRSKHDFICDCDGSSQLLGHLTLKCRQWKLELTARVDIREAIEEAKRWGYAVTHIGQLSRPDGSSFSIEECRSALGLFQHFLSFARGAWCGLHLTMGISEEQTPVFWLWDRQVIDRWDNRPTWWDEQHGDILIELLPGFEKVWDSELWHDALREVIYWYVLANSLPNVDAAVILAHSALELLSWTYLVVEKKCVARKRFRNLRASEKIRNLFDSLGIPLEMPDGADELQGAFKDKKDRDLAWAFTDVRNSIIHPDDSKIREDVRPARIASQVGLWCVELALLRIMGYAGKYRNRLKHEWVGDVEDVPWAESTNASGHNNR